MKSTLNNSNQSWWHHHLLLVPLLVSALFSCTTAQNSSSNAPPSPYGLDANFNPSMAIIIVVLISAFFFMGFFSIYIRQCAGAGAGRTDRSIRPATNQTGRSRRAQRGLDPSVIETFPTFAYSIVKGLKIGKGALECAVCLNEFEDDETLRLLPKCDHVFHPECIDAWLVSHITCPVCRANLTPDSTTTNTTCSDEDEHEENETNENENEISVSMAAAEDEQETETEAAAATATATATATVPQPEVYINTSSIPIQNRPARSKSSTRPRIRGGKFPRSHSTGHSLIQPGENCDRFTLRLPEDVRKQIMLSRTKSSFPVVGDGSFSRRSSRRGYRGSGGESGSSRGGGKYYQMWKLDRSQRAKSDRWVFSMAPPFLSRTGSVRSPKGGVNGEDEGSVNSRNIFKTPFDCLSPRVNGGGQATSSSSSTRLPV